MQILTNITIKFAVNNSANNLKKTMGYITVLLSKK